MKNIKLLRATRGMSQKDLAEQMGISRNSVINMEKDTQRSVTPKAAKKLCEIFGCSICQLYGLDNIRHLPETKEEAERLIRLIQKEYE